VRSGFIQNGTNLYLNLEALFTAVLGQSISSEELATLRPFRAIGVSTQVEPMTVNGIVAMHAVFTESGENGSIQRQLITPLTPQEVDTVVALFDTWG
jgi:hypothetical protein